MVTYAMRRLHILDMHDLFRFPCAVTPAEAFASNKYNAVAPFAAPMTVALEMKNKGEKALLSNVRFDFIY